MMVIGFLLIQYREETMTWLTICVGGLFFVSGLISCIGYYLEKDKMGRLQAKLQPGETLDLKKPTFPLVGIGSIVLGVILAMIPNTFMTGLVYVLAAALILGAINQYLNLGASRQYAHVPFYYWLFPTAILVFSVILITKPMEVASLPLLIIGWLCIFYGVIELAVLFRIVRVKSTFDKKNPTVQASAIDDNIEDAEIIEEEK